MLLFAGISAKLANGVSMWAVFWSGLSLSIGFLMLFSSLDSTPRGDFFELRIFTRRFPGKLVFTRCTGSLH